MDRVIYKISDVINYLRAKECEGNGVYAYTYGLDILSFYPSESIDTLIHCLHSEYDDYCEIIPLGDEPQVFADCMPMDDYSCTEAFIRALSTVSPNEDLYIQFY